MLHNVWKSYWFIRMENVLRFQGLPLSFPHLKGRVSTDFRREH